MVWKAGCGQAVKAPRRRYRTIFNDVSITRLHAFIYLSLVCANASETNGRCAPFKREEEMPTAEHRAEDAGKLGSSLRRGAAPSSLTAIAVKYARCRI